MYKSDGSYLIVVSRSCGTLRKSDQLASVRSGSGQVPLPRQLSLDSPHQQFQLLSSVNRIYAKLTVHMCSHEVRHPIYSSCRYDPARLIWQATVSSATMIVSRFTTSLWPLPAPNNLHTKKELLRIDDALIENHFSRYSSGGISSSLWNESDK